MKEEIIEGNKLIAEFMGVPKLQKEKFYFTPYYKALSGEVAYCHEEDLQYHSPWDWLMPVVEKIEGKEIDLGLSVVIKNEMCRVYRYKSSPYEYPITDLCQGNSKIEAVWQAVIKFIKWYNSQKQEL